QGEVYGQTPPVLAARFFRVRAMSNQSQERHRTSTFVRTVRRGLSEWFKIGHGARNERTEKRKGSRTPTDAGLPACLAASAHPAGRARLSAFHGGSALGTHASQGAVSDQVSRRWLHDGGGSPAGANPGFSEHLARRS